ncbi:glycosyltransferase [Shewanella sp. 10N.286.45.A1]|uniref:glycosyltransferase n=1 Tax=Shewanella sp. 10N.286.45.A1 TaxID=3229694 RepID=UPI00354F54C2
MTKKLLIVVAAIGGGGAERVAVQLANFFSLKDFSVNVCCWNKRKKEYSIIDNVLVSRISAKNRTLDLVQIIEHFQPDFILSFTDASNVITYFAKKMAKSDAIHIPTIHSDLYNRDRNIEFGFVTKILGIIHKYVCRKSNKVVVVSDGAKQSLINYYGLSNSQCIRIYNPVLDENYMTRSPKSNESTATDIDSKLRIVSAGRLTLAKNYPLIIKVAKELKDRDYSFSIDIFGTGELEAEIRELINQNDLSKHVYLRGFVDNLTATLNEYDLFLMTSSWEGFGNVLVEALDAGLDIISTDCPSGPKEILANGKFGTLVPVGEASPIVDSILNKSYISAVNPEELNAHLYSFTLTAIGNEYFDLFNKLR